MNKNKFINKTYFAFGVSIILNEKQYTFFPIHIPKLKYLGNWIHSLFWIDEIKGGERR